MEYPEEYLRDERLMERQLAQSERQGEALQAEAKRLQDIAFGRAPATNRGGYTFWVLNNFLNSGVGTIFCILGGAFMLWVAYVFWSDIFHCIFG